MVAIVAGNGLGLFNASLNTLGGVGVFGQGGLGQAGGQALVNAQNGNLVLQFSDQQLSGLGRDLLHTRTYNTLGALSDGDGDGWRWDGERRVVLSGVRNTAGSRLTRTTGDGHEAVYEWSGSHYRSTAGDGAHDSLQWDEASGEWRWTDGSRRSEERYAGDSGRLLWQSDAAGTRISYGYDAAGRLASVKDSSGQELVLVYGAAGKLERLDTRTSEGGALTRRVYYSYDELGRLAGVATDLSPDDNSIADGHIYATTYGYDGSSFRMASVSQSDGTAVSFTYLLVDGEYRVRTVSDAAGTTTFTYDPANRRTDVSNGLGQQWSYLYDAAGQLSEVHSPALNGQRRVTGYAYDGDGNLTRLTDGSGQAVTYGYDGNGNRILERDALGNTLARVYSARNQLLNEIRYSQPATWNATTGAWAEPPASATQVTRYVYDGEDRLRFVIDASGTVSEYRYHANGLRSHEIGYGDAAYPLAGLTPTTGLSETQLSAWAAQRDLQRASLTELSYDYRGNLSLRFTYATVGAGGGVIDAAGIATQYVYSEHGQLLQTIAVRGAERTAPTLLSSTVYDGLGRVLGQLDSSGTRTYTYAYRGLAVTNAAGLTVVQTFDAQGRLTSLSESGVGVSRSTQYVYDAAGRRVMEQDATGVRRYTFYDEAGRVSARVDGSGAVTEYGYDAAGQRTLERQYATRVDTSSWFNGTAVTKTLLGQIRPAAHAADRSKTYAYDEAGRLRSSTDAAGIVTTYSYDGRGQLIQQQTGERVTRTFYDAVGRQIGQLDGEGYLREQVYDAAGQPRQVIRYGNATLAANRASGSLAQLRPAGGSNLSSWYFYDAAGRQIGSVDEQGFVSETVFDEAGNRQQSIRYATPYTAAITASTGFATLKAAVAGGAKQISTTVFDSQGRVATRTAVDGSVTAYEYDAAGRLIRETSAQGAPGERSTHTRYDAAGQVIGKLLGEASARISAGMSDAQVQAVYAQYGLTYTYDPAGRVASVTDAAGNRTASYYDEQGRLTHVINALGEVSETLYNAFGEASERSQLSNRLAAADTAGLTGGALTSSVKSLVQAIRNASTDNRSSYTYDKRGLLSSSSDALGYLTTYGYNDFGEQTAVTRTISAGATPLSVTQTYAYNKRGERIGSVEDAGGLARATSTAYDAFGRVISQTDGTGQVRTTRYDNNGRVIVQTNPLNQSQRSEYDAFGRLLSQTDALGQVTTYGYDDSARRLTVTTPDGVRVTTEKNRHGQTLTVTDGSGAVTRYGYDKDGQLRTTTDALGQVTASNAYDSAGRLLSVTDVLGRVTRYGYDAANRVITRTDAAGTVTRYAFDGQGRQVRVTEAEGKAEQRLTDYAYDRKGQVLTVTQDPTGLKLTTSYRYDGLGQQVEVARGTAASPKQQVTLYGFDSLGRRISERQDPNGLNLTTRYVYDGNDRVTRKLDAAGNSTWYVYDKAGRLIDTVDALGGVTRNTYDKNGQVISTRRYATALTGDVLAGLGDTPSSITPVSSTKDQLNYLVYDERGRVRYTIDILNQVSETLYDNAGRVLESRRYDTAIAAATPRTLSDTAAALLAANAQARSSRYAYDAVGQLKSVTDAAGKIERYTYDAVGNRKTLTNKNGHVWTYQYDALNRLVEEISPATLVASITDAGVVAVGNRVLVTRIDYDALGNVISRQEGRQRLNAAADPALDDLSQARTTGYAYDAVGRQIRTTSPGWYNKALGQFQQAADGTANTFQVSTEVTYDALGNAVRNRVRVNNTGVAANDFVDSYKVYDALGRVSHDIDAQKGVTAYGYDALGQTTRTLRYANALTAAVPARGYYLAADLSASALVANPAQDRTLLVSYDALGRKTAVQQNRVDVYRFTGNVASSTLSQVAPTTLYSYDAFGQLVRETQVARDANGATVQTGASTVHYYDRLGQRIGSVDALGHYSRLEYDALGQLVRQTDYATALTSWNENALPAAPAAHANDRRTRFTYDAMGRTLQTSLEGARFWQQSIDANGVVSASLVTAELLLSRSTYDGVGNVKTVTDAHGNVTSTDYNAQGHVLKVTEPARATAQHGAVDAFAQATVQATPITEYQLNAFGQVVRELRRAGVDTTFGPTQIIRTRYDAAGHEIQELDAAASAHNYKVDVAGRRLEESRQVNVTLGAWTVNSSALSVNQTLKRTFEYDALGQQIATVDWYTDAAGASQATRNGALYNRFGEVTEKQLNGHLLARYSYDQAGRLVQQQDAQGLTQIDYDLTGKASRSTQLGDTSTSADDRITYQKNDLLGRTLEQHLPAFEANLNADTLNNVSLTLVTPVIKQSYDRWGNVLSRTDARGYVTTYSYNHANQLLTETLPVTDILRENGTSYRASLIHEKRYDALGQLVQEADWVGPYTGVATSTLLRTRQHVYDEAGQLTRDIDALGYSRHYRFDAHGNRVATQNALGTVLVDGYDAMNRHINHGIIRDGAKVILQTNQYDQAGRLYGEISGASAIEETLSSVANTSNWTSTTTGVAGTVKYTLFDERGNIVRTRNESKVEKRFEYDVHNRKVKEIDGLNNTLTWTYDAGNFGRLSSRKDLGGRIYSFTYNGFGQLSKEGLTTSTGIGPDKTYSYYVNGLAKAIVEGTLTKDTAGIITAEDSRTSSYEYDVVGNRIREINAGHYYKAGGANQTSSAETRYKFDEQGRLKEVKAPAGNQLVGALGTQYSLVSTARIDALQYRYDELGNRRNVFLNTIDQAGNKSVLDDWFTYDLEGRVLRYGKFWNTTTGPNKLVTKDYADPNRSHFAGDRNSLANEIAVWNEAKKGFSISYDALGRRMLMREYKDSLWGGVEYSSDSAYWVDWYYRGYREDIDTYSYNDLGQLVGIASTVNQHRNTQDDASFFPVAHKYSFAKYSANYSAYGLMLSQSERNINFVMPDLLNGNAWNPYYTDCPAEITADEHLQSVYLYRGDGQLIEQNVYDLHWGRIKQRDYYNESGMYNAAGIRGASRYVAYNFNGSINHRGDNAVGNLLFDTYKEHKVTATWTAPGTPGVTTNSYNSRGELLRVDVSGSKTFSRLFSSNREGQLNTTLTAGKVQSHIYFDGREVANIGNASKPALINTFEKNLSSSSSVSSGSYTVSAGENLQTIAWQIWGDVSLWYLIADTNGLDVSKPLVPGDTLKIPSINGRTHNAAGDFKPYDPNDVIGNTTPRPKSPPPPPKKKKCGGIAKVVMVVVAVVVSVFTGGVAGAMLGSALSQLAGKAMGVVDNFSWKQVVASGISAGISAGIGSALGTASQSSAQLASQGVTEYGKLAASAALNYAGSYAANKIVGLEASFSWSGMAASVVGANIGGQLGGAFGEGFTGKLIGNQLSAHASAAIEDKWFGGARPNYGQIAADAFGNTLGNAIVAGMKRSAAEQERQRRLEAWTDGELMRAEARMRDVETFAAPASKPLDWTLEDYIYDVYPELTRSAKRGGSGIASQYTAFPKMNWSPTLNVSSLGRYETTEQRYYAALHAAVDTDVPLIDPATGAPFDIPVPQSSGPKLSLSQRIGYYAIIPRQQLTGDFIHDNLATISNVFNTPLNAVGVLGGLINEALSAGDGVGHQLLNASMGLPGFGNGARIGSEALAGWSAVALARAEARTAKALVPNQNFSISVRNGNNNRNVDWFDLDAVISDMSSSSIGRTVLDAADSSQIRLQFSRSYYRDGLLGAEKFDVGGVTFVRSHGQKSATKAKVFLPMVGSNARAAEIAIHEGVHGLGVAGSRRAEVLARAAEVMHRTGSDTVPLSTLKRIYRQVNSIPVYQADPLKIGLQSPLFPGVTF